MKLIRVTLRNGETRLQKLPDSVTLHQIWRIWRSDGDAIGDIWCAQFGAISHADVVEVPDNEAPRGNTAQQQRLPEGVTFKFPGQA